MRGSDTHAAAGGRTKGWSAPGYGEALVFSTSLGALPAGLTLNASTGVISGTPTGSGVSTFTVTVLNSGGISAQALSIDVKHLAPTITTASALPAATKGAVYSATITGTGEAVVYSFGVGAPAGLSISAAGVISGTPTTAGDFTFPINVGNTGGATSKTFTLTVNNSAPVITTVSLLNATRNTAYSQAVVATGESLTFSVSAGTLPSGLTLNPTTGVIAGTAWFSGSSSFTIQVTNAIGTSSRALSINVENTAPIGPQTQDFTAQKGVELWAYIDVAGKYLTFSVLSGSLPSG